MTPSIELTKKGNFAAWESGSFNPKYSTGNSICVAGANFEKLNVLFDSPINKSKKHFLYVLDVGVYFCEARVSLSEDNLFKIKVTLDRVLSIRTENIQGHAVCKADTESVWACQSTHSSKDSALSLPEYSSDNLGYKKEAFEFMQATLDKAFTLSENQKLFWGIPRKASD